MALNLSTVAQEVELPEGEVLISTCRPAGEGVGPAALAPWEGVVVAST